MTKSVHSGPLVTVLMPVYNTATYVKEAVESILNQTFTDFELLIIDDASTDETVALIQKFDDKRISLIIKPQNSGYTDSLNLGLTLAKGKYIARMDGDDISLPQRFEKQVAFLDANPDHILCATLYQVIGSEKVSNHPPDHEAIKAKLISGCYIAHPTVMIRKESIDQHQLHYNREMEPAEDYELWSRMVFRGKLANLDEILLMYRVHPGQTSAVRSQKQKQVSNYVRMTMLQKILPELDRNMPLFNLDIPITTNGLAQELKIRFAVLDQLLAENHRTQFYLPGLFAEFIAGEKKNLSVAILNYRGKSVELAVKLVFQVPVFYHYSGLKSSLRFLYSSFVKKN